MDTPYNVLFLCTGNSARSIMGEALIRHWGGARFRGFSAGSHPRGSVHPLALEVLRRFHLPVQGLRSKSWDEFAGPSAPPLNFVFTVCDRAASEVCPIWPGQPMTAHWGIEDPAAVEGSDEVRTRAFVKAFGTGRAREDLHEPAPRAARPAGASEEARRHRADAVHERGDVPGHPQIMMPVGFSKRLAAEALGTALLVAAVVGSGIMGDRLAGGNVAIALLANTIATGAALVALIVTFGPISGAHLNPLVTAMEAWAGRLAPADAIGYAAGQIAGPVLGVVLAHAMVGVAPYSVSEHVRSGMAQEAEQRPSRRLA